MSEPVKRVRITHPRTEAARRGAARPPAREIDEQTALGEVYMRSLIRSQRRLAVTVCGGVGVLLVGIAMAGALAPRFALVRVLGIPLPWLLLGVLIYPALIVLAAYAVRQAERNEQAFTELVRKR
jgi:hypothetical protein